MNHDFKEGDRAIYIGRGLDYMKEGVIKKDPYGDLAFFWDSCNGNGFTPLQGVVKHLVLCASSLLVPPVITETKCSTCSKENDAGVNSCWWCGNKP
jgi:hypothetical protein